MSERGVNRPRPREQERKRLALAVALRALSRPLVLGDSPLLDEPSLGQLALERYPDQVLAEELALSDLVHEAAEKVLARMGQDKRLERERAVLAEVLGGGSVGAAARRVGRSREHISNTSWKTVTLWVLAEFEDLCRELRAKVDSRPTGSGRRISAVG